MDHPKTDDPQKIVQIPLAELLQMIKRERAAAARERAALRSALKQTRDANRWLMATITGCTEKRAGITGMIAKEKA